MWKRRAVATLIAALLPACAFAEAHHVAFLIHLHVREALLTQHLEVGAGPLLLLERWRGNLGQGDELADEAIVVAVDECRGLLELGAVEDSTDASIWGLCERQREFGVGRAVIRFWRAPSVRVFCSCLRWFGCWSNSSRPELRYRRKALRCCRLRI